MIPVLPMGNTPDGESSNVGGHDQRNHSTPTATTATTAATATTTSSTPSASMSRDPSSMVPGASRNPVTTGVAVNVPQHHVSANTGSGGRNSENNMGHVPQTSGVGVVSNDNSNNPLVMGGNVGISSGEADPTGRNKSGGLPSHSGMPLRPHQNAVAISPYMAQTTSQFNAQFPMHSLIPIPPGGSPSLNGNEGDHGETDAEAHLAGKSGKPLSNTKRAAQNRSAQKAFRQRRDRYIKDLEAKAEEFDRLDAQVAALSQENESLKRYVIELEQRLMATHAP
ncbi:bZIP transcription factor LALA0_S02e11122g [Lachancea lanzarotensis]|uniref:Putative transcription factor kapC n=1 Tax=Lachancea lanzarotensis TaxID=1245769 RepID=A0A0C7N791_9SACH|nr:uncharacterized protein LALA0_S02e11122g [Lachancea lanzarotensis]CEP61293.1 LALA0S02e11122g1_1 [Lachancea lanzarotensis]